MYTHTHTHTHTHIYTHILLKKLRNILYFIHIFENVSLKDQEFLIIIPKISIILNVINYMINVQISLSLFLTTSNERKVKVKVAQSSLTLCDPMDYTVHGILQARILEWVVFPFSRGSSQPRDQTQGSHIAGEFFTSWATGKVRINPIYCSWLIQLFIDLLFLQLIC